MGFSKNKNNLFIFLLFLFCSNFNSQIKISGNILDQNQNPLEGAIVQVKNKSDKSVLAYARSDEKGFFQMDVPFVSSYYVECNRIGFEADIQEFSLKESEKKENLNFSLSEKVKTIDEVKILGQSSVIKQKGDTLSYNVKGFTNGNEKNLKDVLNKLPGFEVREDGKIVVGGKTVDKLLVDGKEFFGDNQQIATENLAAAMVGNVDVINNYTNNSNIKEFDSSNKTAVNIGIKEEYKGKISGDVSLITAYENRYKAGANLFRFDKKANISFIGNSNNTNQESITFEQYFNMKKSIQSDFVSDSRTDYNNFSIPKSLLSDDRVSKKNLNFGAFNLSYVPDGKLKINAYTILNNNFQNRNILETNTFFNPQLNITNQNKIFQKENLFFSQTKLSAEYQLNEKKLLNYSFSFDPSITKQNKTILQTQNTSINHISESENEHKIDFGQQLSFANRLSSNKLFSIYAYQELKNQKNKYDLYSDLSLFDLSNVFLQTQNFKQNEIGFLSKFTIKPKNIIYSVGLGYAYTRQDYQSNLDANVNTFINDLSIERNRFSFDAEISKKRGFFQFSIYNRFSYIRLQNSNPKRLLLPSIQAKFEFSPTSLLSFYYKEMNYFAQQNQIFESKVIDNYYTIKEDNQIRENQLLNDNKLGANYLYIDLLSGTALFADINFSNKKQSLTSNSTLIHNYTAVKNVLTDVNSTLGSNISFERRIKFIKSRIKTTFVYTNLKGQNFISGIGNEFSSEFFSSKFSLYSKFKNKIFNYNLGYETQVNRTEFENNLSTKLETKKLFANFDGSFKDDIRYYFNNSYIWNKSENNARHFLKIDLEIVFNSLKKNWEFSLIGNDILNFNETQIIDNSLQDNFLRERITDRLSGFLGVGIKYKLL